MSFYMAPLYSRSRPIPKTFYATHTKASAEFLVSMSRSRILTNSFTSISLFTHCKCHRAFSVVSFFVHSCNRCLGVAPLPPFLGDVVKHSLSDSATLWCFIKIHSCWCCWWGKKATPPAEWSLWLYFWLSGTSTFETKHFSIQAKITRVSPSRSFPAFRLRMCVLLSS